MIREPEDGNYAQSFGKLFQFGFELREIWWMTCVFAFPFSSLQKFSFSSRGDGSTNRSDPLLLRKRVGPDSSLSV